MSDWAEFSGKTREEAIEEATEVLGFDEEQLIVEDLEEADGQARLRAMARPEAVAEEMAEEAAELLQLMGFEARCDVSQEGEFTFVDIETPDSDTLIGDYGETLDALQYLVVRMNELGGEGMPLVLLDTDNFRKERIDRLGRVAEDLSKDVLETGKEEYFDPMDPVDRKIVHYLLKDREGIRTYSRGRGEDRHVVIALDKARD